MSMIGQNPRGVAAPALAAAGLALLFSTASAAAQEHYQWRTTEGCLFFLDYDPVGKRDAYRWLGSCTPGQLINGQGTMESGHPAGSYFDQWTGQMIDGYWHGTVSMARFKASDRSWVGNPPSVVYNMGCVIGYPDEPLLSLGSCIPGGRSGSAAARARRATCRRPGPDVARGPGPARPRRTRRRGGPD